MKRIAVVAGNYAQFVYHAELRAKEIGASEASMIFHRRDAMIQIGDLQFWYVNSPWQVRGLPLDAFEKWGTWYEPGGVVDEIEKEALMRIEGEKRIQRGRERWSAVGRL
jgi:hypothetical protein